MNNHTIEQALCGFSSDTFEVIASSEGLSPERHQAVLDLCAGFGPVPEGRACPECMFVVPFAANSVALVRVKTLGEPSGPLRFHLLIIPTAVYISQGGDPFLLASQLPACWKADLTLSTLAAPTGSLSPRTVELVRTIFQEGDSPLLLGAAQVLVDGGRFVAVRAVPDHKLCEAIWALLPYSTRSRLRVATFAFEPISSFDMLIVPAADLVPRAGYVTEALAGEYPEGYYELHLQLAAEDGDQADLDRLFARRSLTQTWSLGLLLLGLFVALLIFGALLGVPRPRAH